MKRNLQPFLIIGSLTAVCLFAFAFYAWHGIANATLGMTQHQSSVGRPAIIPSGTGAIRVTTSDVRAYVNAHPFPSGPTTTGNSQVIQSIDLITSAEASTRLKDESIGLPASSMVYYVVVKGPFTTQNVSLPSGDKKGLPSPTYGVEVFDAQTGNFLLWWIPN